MTHQVKKYLRDKACRSALFALAALSAAAFPAQAQNGDIPANATKSDYGDRWKCEKGYVESEGACLAVVTPANAYPTSK